MGTEGKNVGGGREGIVYTGGWMVDESCTVDMGNIVRG